MVKSAIKVVVRVRPTPNFAASAIDLHADKKVPHPPLRELPRPPAFPPLSFPLSQFTLSQFSLVVCRRSMSTSPRTPSSEMWSTASLKTTTSSAPLSRFFSRLLPLSLSRARSRSLSFLRPLAPLSLHRFDSVMNNASQETMYEVAAEETVTSVLNGYNGTIMAYLLHSIALISFVSESCAAMAADQATDCPEQVRSDGR